MKERTADLALGRWNEIHQALGMGERYQTGKHLPCPSCGGSDRFRLVGDKLGGAFCGDNRLADGFAVWQHLQGWDFKTTAKKVDLIVGNCQVDKRKPKQPQNTHYKLLRGCVPAERNVIGYLLGRELEAPQNGLGFHASLGYWEAGESLGNYTAMVGVIRNLSGEPKGAHITYLDQGKKANVPTAKKMRGSELSGCAVQLYDHGDHLGLAEGIETAIAAKMLHDVPTWACLSSGSMEAFQIPKGVKKLTIFADNDASYAGHKAAYALAYKAKRAGIDCAVMFPETQGDDWNDVLIKLKQK